jgi:sec-independent protein translocase protein TatA
MVTDILQPTHLLFVLVVALLVLGPKRLPEVARTLGNGLRDFRSALSGDSDERPGRSGHYTIADETDPADSEPLYAHRPAGPPAASAAPPAAGPATSAVHRYTPTTPPTEEQDAPTERQTAPPHDSSGSPPA